MALTSFWRSYSNMERRNIAIYITGIMFYKFGLGLFSGSITTLAADQGNSANTFTKLGATQGINQAAQCVGAILVAPLIKRWPTRTVLVSAILFFSLMTTILLIVDAATGGQLRSNTNDGKVKYGSWNPNAIFAIWTFSGIAYGMVELIRRVIPCDIVGGNVGKLRRMDATVHLFYKIFGIIGAFAFSFSLLTTVSTFFNASTGEQLGSDTKANKIRYGAWISRAALIIWIFGGIAYGMVVPINRVIPRDIIGGNVGRVRKTDATVVRRSGPRPRTRGKGK